MVSPLLVPINKSTMQPEQKCSLTTTPITATTSSAGSRSHQLPNTSATSYNTILRHGRDYFGPLAAYSNSKSAYYLTYRSFDEDGSASLVPASKLPPMTLSSGDSGITTPIEQYDSTTAHRTLGNWLSTNLQMNTAFEKLESRAGTYTRGIAVGYLTPYNA